ncbi:hypothetical protein CONCODRAFT_10793 [Conidiobolus coronatus NRRL 28638]|uniref:Extracellular membrane protein CFEM domain-containing protein n=1 Tax=Conidiobolus coronatus (strain ATCC 28846 / CBS 209.66 / NRRL 28638) TaxID=796925 RepID=A0A137NWI5_CONC2|nr:hypothetical protein CONCODRAFT_10793 [Conidiobolus coronatus NRRL 28638]|eukprot:KXN67195.1 hypothetical protein CONCODRAFT_10793 [Conidiobolus coronatus NRRL 28638]
MKLNHSLLFYVTCILSAPQDEVQLPGCITKTECKLLDTFEKFRFDPNVIKCNELKNNEDSFKCAYKVMGYKENQAEVLFKLVPAFEKCSASSIPQTKACLSKCSDNQSCKESCELIRGETDLDCFAKQYDIKDFDAKKAAKCSSECDKDTVAEIIDCDMKCKEPIYKKFESSTKDSKLTSSANRSNTKSLTGLFGIIFVPILFSIIL